MVGSLTYGSVETLRKRSPSKTLVVACDIPLMKTAVGHVALHIAAVDFAGKHITHSEVYYNVSTKARKVKGGTVKYASLEATLSGQDDVVAASAILFALAPMAGLYLPSPMDTELVSDIVSSVGEHRIGSIWYAAQEALIVNRKHIIEKAKEIASTLSL